jgi:hypothetical protein
MPYSYAEMKDSLFTPDGTRCLLAVRDSAFRMLKASGAFVCWAVLRDTAGDDWVRLACLDYLTELGEIREVPLTPPPAGQDRLFLAGPEFSARKGA